MRDSAWFLLGLCSLLGGGCSGKRQVPAPVASVASAKAAVPIDHLAADELAPGNLEVFGFAVPRGMQIQNRFSDRVYLNGRVSPEALANYVNEQVVVSHVEVGVARTVFPMARIKGGPPDRLFELEVLPDGAGTRLVIKDVTPPPPPPPGLTDAERWRAAGLTPDGHPLDPKKLE